MASCVPDTHSHYKLNDKNSARITYICQQKQPPLWHFAVVYQAFAGVIIILFQRFSTAKKYKLYLNAIFFVPLLPYFPLGLFENQTKSKSKVRRVKLRKILMQTKFDSQIISLYLLIRYIYYNEFERL